jgi:hypothetical protein
VDDAQPAFNLYPYDAPHDGGLWVRTPSAHGQILHGGGRGCVAIAQRETASLWREKSHPVEVVIELLKHYKGVEDVYLSTQRFKGRRRIAYLLSLSALYTDLDYYKIPHLASLPAQAVLELARTCLQKARMPEPTLAIGSGRGLYLLWLHSVLPRSALPRWTACQRKLWEVLKDLGADRAAIDAARVLRVVGTIHKETGAMVETLAPLGKVANFEELVIKILPLHRAELADLRVQRALRRTRSASKPHHLPPQGFTQATLWEARLSDLQHLRELRFMDYQMADYRDRWLFLSGVAMSWLALPTVLQRELYALAHQAGGWTEGHTRSKLKAVFRTAHQAARGEKVSYAGVEVDPRYRFRNQTIIELLEIDAEEERQLTTIISDTERRRRDREEKKRERCEAGAMSRQEYEGRAAERRAAARRLASEGLSLRAIGRILGISHEAVRKALRNSCG